MELSQCDQRDEGRFAISMEVSRPSAGREFASAKQLIHHDDLSAHDFVMFAGKAGARARPGDSIDYRNNVAARFFTQAGPFRSSLPSWRARTAGTSGELRFKL
jgi:hypothetical protein